MLVRVLFLSMLESALTRFVNLDPDARQFLSPVAGKVIRIDLEIVHWSFYLCPTQSGIQLLESCETSPDTTLSGSPLAFAAMGLSHRPMNSIFSGEIKIHGNTSVGRSVQMLFEQLDIDWEEQLSFLSGDILAHKIGNLVRSTNHWGQESVDSLTLSIGEYFKEESRDLLSSYECNAFLANVDRIRADVDRLQVRINRLQQLAENALPAQANRPD